MKRRRLLEILSSEPDEHPPGLILTGKPTSEHGPFLQSVARECTENSWTVRYVPVDPDGYEPDRRTVEQLGSFQVKKHGCRQSHVGAPLWGLKAGVQIPASLGTALAIQIALQQAGRSDPAPQLTKEG